MVKLDNHQVVAINSIKKTLQSEDKCLVSMMCGTGKTRIMFKYCLKNHNKIVIVCPNLILVEQLNIDYLLDKKWKKYIRSTTNDC